jgi:hypothetical protein
MGGEYIQGFKRVLTVLKYTPDRPTKPLLFHEPIQGSIWKMDRILIGEKRAWKWMMT